MTEEQLKAFVAAKLVSKKRRALTRTGFVSAWQASTTARKDAIVGALRRGDKAAVGKHFVQMVNHYARAQAEIDAETMVADGSLDLAELSEILD